LVKQAVRSTLDGFEPHPRRIFEPSEIQEIMAFVKKIGQKAAPNAFPWMNYFWGVLIGAYKEFEDRVGTIRTGKGSKTERIRMTVHRKIRPFAISDIEADCPGVSRDMIRMVLRRLRDEKAIVPQGKGRGAKWVRVKELA